MGKTTEVKIKRQQPIVGAAGPLVDPRTCNGQELKHLMAAGTAWLEKNAAQINALNVFPVPDGDTGTNMLLTMQAAIAEIANNTSEHAGEIAKGISRGALMGARGNSGVILSQILHGFAYAIEDKPRFTSQCFARALRESCNTAYQAVTQAVEGTILTVIREMADEAEKAAPSTDNLIALLQRVVVAADAAVKKTPTLLRTLQEAGVVDAGGLGLQVIFEGALRYVQGEPLDTQITEVTTAGSEFAHAPLTEMTYGYCTEFILRGHNLNYEKIKTDLLEMGDSALIVGDEGLIRVHIHTFRPGQVLDYATQHGTLHKIKIDNMQEQHHHFSGLDMTETSPLVQPAPAPASSTVTGDIGIVAVVPGPGLEEIFKSMGAGIVIRGGQTMNPSTQELLQAIEQTGTQQVIILPNNKNVMLAAQQAAQLTERQVHVLPTHSVPQGIAALLSFNYQENLDENVAAMTEAIGEVQTGEVTRAVRSVAINNIEVQEGEIIGLLNGELVASDTDIDNMVLRLLEEMEADQYDIITLYYGEEVDEEAATAMAGRLTEAYPEQEVEVVAGGQPYYYYIISVE